MSEPPEQREGLLWRRTGWVFILVLFLATLFFWHGTVVDSGLRNAMDESSAEDASFRRHASTPETEVREPQAERLHIWLRPLNKPRFTSFKNPLPVGAIWPDAADENWDHEALESLSSSGLLRDAVRRRREVEEGRQILDLAHEEGLLGDHEVVTPEEAFVQLQLRWLEMEVNMREAYRSYYARHLPPGVIWPMVPASERKEIVLRESMPMPDARLLFESVQFTLERWPDHPVVEHAHLAAITSDIVATEGSEPLDGHVLTHLAAIHDPRILEEGVLLITATRLRADSEVLDFVLAFEMSSSARDIHSAAWVQTTASKQGQWEIAMRANEKLASALADCTLGPPHVDRGDDALARVWSTHVA